MFTPIFDRSLYDAGTLQPSYWEDTVQRRDFPVLQADLACDVAIIGGGYTGLAAAYHLARDHGIDTAVLEAGPIAWGASSRNGGFMSYPPTKLGIGAMIDRYGLDDTRRFFADLRAAADYPREIAQEEGFDIRLQGDGTFDAAHNAHAAEGLRASAEAHARVGIRTTLYSREAFTAIGHGGTEQFGGLHVEGGGGLHPLAYAMGLADAAARRGVKLFASSPVERWERDGSRHRLVTPGGTVTARRVVFATNGWTPDGLHKAIDARIWPALSNIVVTRPLSEAELQAAPYVTDTPVSNTRKLLFYYRLLPDRRFLFGARGDVSGTPRAAAAMRAWMERRIGELFPAWKDVGTDYFWRGLVALSLKLAPSVGRVPDDPSVYYGFAYHGSGVVAGPLAGRYLARAIGASPDGGVDVPAPLAGLPPRFALPGLRRPALAMVYAGYGVKEWLGDRL
ncbi:NAD(P)/FAD-dependent oxidoreductase [Labrys monachus]|uniref:Glycine/D-amino acid oxidase-like deaminating enzyme n=1 Tax=Labrys monachus TaxID=217067 RepID=A0ABU0FPM9_9HYPH|nr:FAD-binding oxidoreductase [Labrys monachus]MDQ0396018.1 glycine/D-amino acid oxidase-like deaminating enzyme [Labrys monachus]